MIFLAGMLTDESLEEKRYHELMLYTLAHHDPSFIHQYVVDAYAASHAAENAKPITTAFALVGLYLALEKGYTGKQVQRAHMRLGHTKKAWPQFDAPTEKSVLNVADVLRTVPGPERDQAIVRWCASVWETWREHHGQIAELVRRELGGARL